MYAPSELLEKVKKQVISKFSDQIISFKWFHEEEYTLIMVQIREVAGQIPVSLSIREIVNTVIGHPDSSEYIVPISVSAIESVEAADGLFKLAYHGGEAIPSLSITTPLSENGQILLRFRFIIGRCLMLPAQYTLIRPRSYGSACFTRLVKCMPLNAG